MPRWHQNQIKLIFLYSLSQILNIFPQHWSAYIHNIKRHTFEIVRLHLCKYVMLEKLNPFCVLLLTNSWNSVHFCTLLSEFHTACGICYRKSCQRWMVFSSDAGQTKRPMKNRRTVRSFDISWRHLVSYILSETERRNNTVEKKREARGSLENPYFFASNFEYIPIQKK